MNHWFYCRGEKVEGPVSEDEIRHLLQSGYINLFDLVFKEGEEEWKLIGTVPEFRDTSSLQEEKKIMSEENTSFDVEKETASESLNISKPWIILKIERKDGQIIPLQEGPYSQIEVESALSSGEIAYRDYAFKSGYRRWVRLGVIPEFDRRTHSREEGGDSVNPFVPIPHYDPKAESEKQIFSNLQVLKPKTALSKNKNEQEEEVPPEAYSKDLVEETSKTVGNAELTADKSAKMKEDNELVEKCDDGISEEVTVIESISEKNSTSVPPEDEGVENTHTGSVLLDNIPPRKRWKRLSLVLGIVFGIFFASFFLNNISDLWMLSGVMEKVTQWISVGRDLQKGGGRGGEKINAANGGLNEIEIPAMTFLEIHPNKEKDSFFLQTDGEKGSEVRIRLIGPREETLRSFTVKLDNAGMAEILPKKLKLSSPGFYSLMADYQGLAHRVDFRWGRNAQIEGKVVDWVVPAVFKEREAYFIQRLAKRELFYSALSLHRYLIQIRTVTQSASNRTLPSGERTVALENVRKLQELVRTRGERNNLYQKDFIELEADVQALREFLKNETIQSRMMTSDDYRSLESRVLGKIRAFGQLSYK